MSAGEKRKPEDPENAEAGADVDKRRKEDPAIKSGEDYSSEIKKIYDSLIPSAETRRKMLMEFVISKLRAAKRPGRILIKVFYDISQNGNDGKSYDELKSFLSSGEFSPFEYAEETEVIGGGAGGAWGAGDAGWATFRCSVYLRTPVFTVFEDDPVAK
jgi:hypothetical protein